MYMSKIVFDQREMTRRNLYGEHRAMWDLFTDGPDRRRDFLFRRTDEGAYLAVSDRKPRQGPLLKHLQVKDYAPRFSRGERILFSLRVNPVRKTRDENGRQVRHDIVQDERTRLEAAVVPREKWPPRLVIAQQAALSWLAVRAEALGLTPETETIMAERYDLHRFRKDRSGRKVTVAMLDVRGFAAVSDPEALVAALSAGIGPAKAFGCGMMLVRRA